MQITLNQTEIEQAIIAFAKTQINITGNIKVGLIAGRGVNGTSATLDITSDEVPTTKEAGVSTNRVPAEEIMEDAAKSKAKAKPAAKTKPAAKAKEEAAKTDIDEEDPNAETEAPFDTNDEVTQAPLEAIEDTQAAKKPLFGN